VYATRIHKNLAAEEREEDAARSSHRNHRFVGSAGLRFQQYGTLCKRLQSVIWGIAVSHKAVCLAARSKLKYARLPRPDRRRTTRSVGDLFDTSPYLQCRFLGSLAEVGTHDRQACFFPVNGHRSAKSITFASPIAPVAISGKLQARRHIFPSIPRIATPTFGNSRPTEGPLRSRQ